MQPQIIILREGTDQSQGKGQLISNINACQAVTDTVRSTLGPRGMDKLMVDSKGTLLLFESCGGIIKLDQIGTVTISNDGATIMKLLEVVHPAAKTLVDIARAQDAEVGDGTTSVVVFAGELLREIKPFIEDNVSPQVIIKGLRAAAELAVKRVKEVAVPIARGSNDEFRETLEKLAATAMNSKLISNHQ